MPNTPTNPNIVNVEDFSDLPPLLEEDVSEMPTLPQQVFVTYWANAPSPAPTVISISYIDEHGECVVVPVNAAERPILPQLITDNIGVQFRRHSN